MSYLRAQQSNDSLTKETSGITNFVSGSYRDSQSSKKIVIDSEGEKLTFADVSFQIVEDAYTKHFEARALQKRVCFSRAIKRFDGTHDA